MLLNRALEFLTDAEPKMRTLGLSEPEQVRSEKANRQGLNGLPEHSPGHAQDSTGPDVDQDGIGPQAHPFAADRRTGQAKIPPVQISSR